MLIERKNYPGLPQPVGPYVHAVKYGGLLFLSGITAFGTPGIGQGIAGQAEAIFSQIAAIAAQEGSSLQNLLKVTIFIREADDLEGLRQVLDSVYGAAKPASSLVVVKSLFAPEIDVEVEATLAVG
ncbi:Endoribonuclease L-PSP [Solidesulfovibrio fructosivorans JJ]]|uniref:Endoribonuclease L-PSP n=1 Tax=Solidesulfovibrio fructosivorans JJ] TaxID=596151 RepID=E1K1N2_SOLFR|nr:RidA family protein [Solidesulfovibrio fructosivorans]EFL49470.1 Endoribonuclease L-PSP [Solidesulfovibrio fructosivorans JJ]]